MVNGAGTENGPVEALKFYIDTKFNMLMDVMLLIYYLKNNFLSIIPSRSM